MPPSNHKSFKAREAVLKVILTERNKKREICTGAHLKFQIMNDGIIEH